jgi:hypothetical protein
MGFTLKKIVPWERSYDEYVAMFSLTEVDLERHILGCGDGPAGFNSELTKRGRHVISVDPSSNGSSSGAGSCIDVFRSPYPVKACFQGLIPFLHPC